MKGDMRNTAGSRLCQATRRGRSEEHTSELQSPCNLVCRLLLEKKKELYTRLFDYLAGQAQTFRQDTGIHLFDDEITTVLSHSPAEPSLVITAAYTLPIT